MSADFLKVSGISATYDKTPTVKDISFTLAEGELACLLGPSGCGKTTILRTISGFQELTSGSISLNDTVLSSDLVNVLPEKRNVGMVFQEHSLFPHLTLSKNIGFGLQNLNRDQRKNKIEEMLGLIGMLDMGGRYPHELSGGQAQRVALARAIAPQPQLLLLDEPFSNLDTELRESLGNEIRDLLKEIGITAIMVTHDQHDAFALGDKVGVMSQGRLLQWDTSFNLYHAPVSRTVANFIGDGVLVNATMIDENVVITNFGEVRGETVNTPHIGKEVDLLIRPDDVTYNPDSSIRGKIIRKAFKGAQTLYTIETESGEQLMSLLPSHDDYEIDDTIGVNVRPDHLVCFLAKN
ncbi:MAG: ABC transporter ATP-binding protein [Acidiferrobacterales bacterium]|nr:ABC transporter ATP-binding protein [Acidiferrobacterales bacterium]